MNIEWKMKNKVTNQRLEEIQDCLIDFLAIGGLRKNPRVTDDELFGMATELLELRKENERLETNEAFHNIPVGSSKRIY
jgi:hypothetical protein